ncbi:potassium transporter TrkG [Sinomonas sp. ASV322]|uniref:TrkH family potassium uptake protein n=1 Tax=Sinomonas sp. ASV322 TaxID=3041920 RepID=UPI0027DC8379|nr:potassium transporter TrkG [Sinomonas sp. ASV322]MDQ4503772.1 potassium transporter TrkG [Sinomonas sp. ASV322]
MAQTQSSWRPSPRHEGLGPLTGLRDFIDRLAASSPARLALLSFTGVILVFTLVLTLPISSADGQVTPLHEALFTAASAVCVTGLTVVSTATHWSAVGQVAILVAIQVGGLGILTLASVLSLAVSRRLGVRGKLIAREAMNNAGRLGEVGGLLRIVVATSAAVEATLALFLTPAFMAHGEDFGQALWHGVFYSISSFNNAGFTPHSDGVVPYQYDLWILVPLMVGGFVGSLGFPVLMVFLRFKARVRLWTLHAKLTVVVSFILLALGAFLWGAMEWDNARTIGGMAPSEKMVQSIFASVMTRSLGFNLVDMNHLEPSTMLLSDALMFAGGGSASTAGGIKVTTVAVMFLAIVAEARGDRDVRAYGRTIPEGVMRVAISVIVMAATLIMVACSLLLAISGQSLDRVLFDSISAFATVGLSTGLAAELPPEGVYILTALMFFGRVGTITMATALALRQRSTLYHYPEERPIIG